MRLKILLFSAEKPLLHIHLSNFPGAMPPRRRNVLNFSSYFFILSPNEFQEVYVFKMLVYRLSLNYVFRTAPFFFVLTDVLRNTYIQKTIGDQSYTKDTGSTKQIINSEKNKCRTYIRIRKHNRKERRNPMLWITSFFDDCS